MRRLLLVLVLIFVLPLSLSAYFPDVYKTDKNYTAINFLFDRGIISGYPDGTFQPENPVSRAELAKILVGGTGVSLDAAKYQNCFPDVGTEWYAEYVCYAKEQGWVQGYPSGEFKPAEEVTRIEAVKMIIESQSIATKAVEKVSFTDVDVS